MPTPSPKAAPAPALAATAPARRAAPEEASAMALLDLHVVPSSSRDQIVGRRGLALKVKLRAPAIDGKANASLLVFLATSLDLRARTLVLISGEHAPEKRLALFGITPAELARRIDAALAAKG